MKNKKNIKISNKKRRSSLTTGVSRESLLGFVEMSTAERFKIYVAASLFLSQDATSGLEIT